MLFQKRVVYIELDIYVLLLSLGPYLCWWIVSSRWYDPPDGRCFSTDFGLLYKCSYYLNVQSPHNVIIIKTKILPKS